MNSKGNAIYFIVLTQEGHQIQSHERENIDYGTVCVFYKFWNPESLGLNNIMRVIGPGSNFSPSISWLQLSISSTSASSVNNPKNCSGRFLQNDIEALIFETWKNYENSIVI